MTRRILPRTHLRRFSLSFSLFPPTTSQAEDAKVEFDTEKDENGKLKAVNVTGVGGAPLTPPPREKRRSRKKTAPEVEKPARDPPFHDVLNDNAKAKITEHGLKLVRNTVDLAMGGARIKLGQGGYASLVDAAGVIGEGTFACDENGKVDFTWERCLKIKDGAWAMAEVKDLMASVHLAEGG